MASDEQQQQLLLLYSGNIGGDSGGGGGNGEGNNNYHQDNDQAAAVAAANGGGGGGGMLTHITVCHRCRRDYFANGDPVNTDVHYLGTFPAGYRFAPSDEELMQQYLISKINNLKLPPNNIVCVNIYESHPVVLIERYWMHGEKEWYFFSPRDRKYANGIRPNRAVGGNRPGYWKATGADKHIEIPKGRLVGYKKALVFYEGAAPEGTKTNWIMHEYRVLNKEEEDRKKGIKVVSRVPPKKKGETKEEEPIDMRLRDCVLCRIYLKPSNPNSRAESEDLDFDNSNGDEQVVAGTSSPVQQNKRMRTSRAKAPAANTPLSLSINEDRNILITRAQPGTQDGMVNNFNGINGNTTGSFSSMLFDTPLPLRTLPSYFYGSDHQQQHMPQPPNDFYNVNYLQHRHVHPPSNFSSSNHQHHMEMISQQLLQRREQRVFQNCFGISRNNNCCTDNFSLHDPSISTDQVHYPPPHHPSTPYNTAPANNYNPYDAAAAALSNFPPPNHDPHPSIINENHTPPGFGSLSSDPSTRTFLMNFATSSLGVLPLHTAYPDQHPVTESLEAHFLFDEFSPDIGEYEVNCAEDEKENISS